MEHSQNSFIFVDKSKANSAGMIQNVKLEIGECTVLEIKSGWKSSFLFGRTFMVIVGEVCDLRKNKMRLTNGDESFLYDHVEKT